LGNLKAAGVTRLTASDVDPQRANEAEALGVRWVPRLEQALGEGPDLVLVCTPPALHVAQAIEALRAGAHVFVEKPLGDSLAGLDVLRAEAESRARVVQVGYNLRFHPCLLLVKRLLDEGAVGRPLWLQAEVAQYLPDWRPSRDYRASYTGRRELGGGILLDGSHELDYVLWLLGSPTEVRCMAGHVSDLDVNVEDCATVLLRFPGRTLASVHLDFVQRNRVRGGRLAGDRGTVSWDLLNGDVRISQPGEGGGERVGTGGSFDETYRAELSSFLDCVRTGGGPRVGLPEAEEALRVALRAREAAGLGGRT
jgi:predicted dehydrogenase